jgi:hypothetical protein
MVKMWQKMENTFHCPVSYPGTASLYSDGNVNSLDRNTDTNNNKRKILYRAFDKIHISTKQG